MLTLVAPLGSRCMKHPLEICLIQNAKKTGQQASVQKKNRQNDALNKAVIPAIWYSFASASVARRGCWLCVFFKGSGFYRDATRKSTCGCRDFLNRRGKGVAPLARIHFRSHATLYSFPERVRRSFTGFLQTSQYAIKWVRCPQHGGKTAFLHIEGRI